MKARHLIILTILILFVQSVAFGQTNEFQYFYHSKYFNDSTIKEHKIKKIQLQVFGQDLKVKYIKTKKIFIRSMN